MEAAVRVGEAQAQPPPPRSLSWALAQSVVWPGSQATSEGWLGVGLRGVRVRSTWQELEATSQVQGQGRWGSQLQGGEREGRERERAGERRGAESLSGPQWGGRSSFLNLLIPAFLSPRNPSDVPGVKVWPVFRVSPVSPVDVKLTIVCTVTLADAGAGSEARVGLCPAGGCVGRLASDYPART